MTLAVCRQITTFLLILVVASCSQDEVFPETYYQCIGTIIDNNSEDNPKSASYKKLTSDIVKLGVPGMMLSVQDGQHGYWSGSSGFADLANGIELQACNLTRVGSTVKTFTAVSILLLQEDGLLDIDDLITNYLSEEEINGLKNAQQSTIRHLLQHSSGIYNYIQNAQFQTESLNDLLKTWQPDELLDYARRKDPYFAPGTDVLYSNTNYVLLGMVIDNVTGKPFYEFFNDRIFGPLDLSFTQFAAIDPVPEGIVRGYIDFYSNLNLINATYYSGWDYFTADGGLISNAHDLNVFLTDLFSGKILSESSMSELMSWQAPKEQNGEGFRTYYGLGIFRIETDYGPAYLHSGDAIGYFASMAYFPRQGVTITWAVNGNYGKLDEYTQSKEAMEKIFHAVLD